ncbi:MAG: hypothetical protein IKG11_04235 [Atopobiaceae bacterium]|nr:hypothetical protein [Atopobiaceae bacterium]
MGKQQTGTEGLWNERRRELYGLLIDLNEGLAELYKRAINELDSLQSEEMSAVTRSTVSYYGRELLNNLPAFLTDDGTVPPRGQYQGLQAQVLKRVVRLAAESNLPAAAIDNQSVPVPGELAMAVRELVEAHEKGSLSRRQRDSVIILGRVQDDVAANGLLEEARTVLTDHQHVDLTQADAISAKSAFVESFKTIEDILLARLGSFFDTVRELRALMSQVEGAGPSEDPDIAEIAKEVLLRLGDYQHRRVFFEGIRSPKWMRHLKDRGAFNAGVRDETDSGAYLRWPEGSYLVAVVDTCADDVLDVCLSAGQSPNPFVQAQLLSSAAKLPGDKAMGLHQVALVWSENMRKIPHYFEPHDAAQLVSNLFRCSSSGRQIGKAEKVLKAFFSPVFERDDEMVRYSRTEVSASIPEYCYDEELEYVVTHSDGRCGYLQIRKLLEHYELRYCESRRLEYGQSGVYMSWRPSIALPGDSYPSNYGNHLVDAFVRVLSKEAEQRSNCLTESYRSKSTLVSRSALYVLGGLVAKAVPPIPEGEENTSYSSEFVKCLAQSILDDPELLNKGFDAEMIALVQACMSRPRVFDTESIVGAIEEYRERQQRAYAASPWLQKLGENERNDIANRQAVSDEHLLLARIGGEVLPRGLAMRLVELDEELGVLSAEDLAFSTLFSVSSWGYTSPLTADQMLKTPANELGGFLREWRSRSVHDEPSVTGLANALQLAVSQDAMHFGGLLASVESLRPRYVGALLEGMSDALDKGNEVPAADLPAVCSWACTRMGVEADDKSDSAVTRAEYYDFRYDAGRLAEKLALSKTTLSAVNWKHLLATGVALSEVREPLKEKQFAKSYPDDPITVLINLLLPKGVEILVRVAGLAPSEEVRKEARDAIARLASLHQDTLVYGALGMAFPPLVEYDPQYAHELASKVLLVDMISLLPAFLYPALYWYRYHHETFCALKSIIQKMIIELHASDYAQGGLISKTTERIGYWLYVEREAGHMMPDDELYLLWRANASSEERRTVLREVCHRASSERAPAGVVKCAMGYWDEVRGYELQSGVTGGLTGVFLLAHNPVVQADWLAPRMAIEASENDVSDELPGVSGRLADVARISPADAMTVLECAVSTQSGAERVTWIGKSLFQVLAYACSSHDETVVHRARALMDRLGRQGMISLDERVHEAMEELGLVEQQAMMTADGEAVRAPKGVLDS